MRKSHLRLLLIAYVAFIIYGSLFPFHGWNFHGVHLAGFLEMEWPVRINKADVAQNVLLYMPFGVLMTIWLSRYAGLRVAFLLTACGGGCLSMAIETLQQLNPSRVSSLIDVLTNIAGTLIGALLTLFPERSSLSGKSMLEIRKSWFPDDAYTNVGLLIIGLWILSQTAPWVPSLDLGHLRHGLSLLLHTQQIDIPQAVTYACYILALGLLASTLGRPEKPVLLAFLMLVGFTLSSKLVIAGRQLSMEALAGALAAACLVRPLSRNSLPTVSRITIALIATGFIVYELTPSPGKAVRSFNWLPFSAQLDTVADMAGVLEFAWPFMAIAYLVQAGLKSQPHRVLRSALAGGIATLALLFFLEWHQQEVPGRYGDITQVIFGVLGWCLPWYLLRQDA